jgi:hypothetical protein
MTQASGTVFRAGRKEFIPFATVKAVKGSEIVYATAGDCGAFALDLPGGGKWTFTAFEKGSYASAAVAVDVDAAGQNIKLYLDRVGEDADDKAGKVFFWSLIALLAVLVAFYLAAHLYLFGRGQPFGIWSTDPLRYLEILLWGLAGILVSKIFISGWYLRKHCFYREGILMHIAHLVATPILVLVVVLILSQAVIMFSISPGNTLSLDLSSPPVMVAFAFIIGTSPWALWNFILNSARKFMSQAD